MNPFVIELSSGEIREKPLSAGRLVVEDNIGEGIHIHLGNCRLEMSVKEFKKFTQSIEMALEELDNGYS